eukprot:Polyplicarium_translucidae@DN2937_c0_g1_i3.p2
MRVYGLLGGSPIAVNTNAFNMEAELLKATPADFLGLCANEAHGVEFLEFGHSWLRQCREPATEVAKFRNRLLTIALKVLGVSDDERFPSDVGAAPMNKLLTQRSLINLLMRQDIGRVMFSADTESLKSHPEKLRVLLRRFGATLHIAFEVGRLTLELMEKNGGHLTGDDAGRTAVALDGILKFVTAMTAGVVGAAGASASGFNLVAGDFPLLAALQQAKEECVALWRDVRPHSAFVLDDGTTLVYRYVDPATNELTYANGKPGHVTQQVDLRCESLQFGCVGVASGTTTASGDGVVGDAVYGSSGTAIPDKGIPLADFTNWLYNATGFCPRDVIRKLRHLGVSVALQAATAVNPTPASVKTTDKNLMERFVKRALSSFTGVCLFRPHQFQDPLTTAFRQPTAATRVAVLQDDNIGEWAWDMYVHDGRNLKADLVEVYLERLGETAQERTLAVQSPQGPYFTATPPPQANVDSFRCVERIITRLLRPEVALHLLMLPQNRDDDLLTSFLVAQPVVHYLLMAACENISALGGVVPAALTPAGKKRLALLAAHVAAMSQRLIDVCDPANVAGSAQGTALRMRGKLCARVWNQQGGGHLMTNIPGCFNHFAVEAVPGAGFDAKAKTAPPVPPPPNQPGQPPVAPVARLDLMIPAARPATGTVRLHAWK